MSRGWLHLSAFIFCASLCCLRGETPTGQKEVPPVQGQDLPTLLETLSGSAGLAGDVVLSLRVQEEILARARVNPHIVVPAIVECLTDLGRQGQETVDYRIALISILERLGPAAEGAVPLLTEMVQEEEDQNQYVLLKARLALEAVGTPAARKTIEAADTGFLNQWAQGASELESSQAVSQQSYFIRRELRSPRMSEDVIRASVHALLAMGLRREEAVSSLLLVWQDQRVGAELRSLTALALAQAGVEDIETAVEQSAEANIENPLDAIISDIRSEDGLVSTLAMMELGDRPPTPLSIDALIQALRENRNSGQAALVLGKFGAGARRAASYLLPYLWDRDVGGNAAQALGLIGANDKRVIAALRQVVADQRSPHRGMAALSLGSLRAASALPELKLALTAADKYTRILAARALGQLGPEAATAVPELTILLQDPDPDLKLNAVNSLGQIGPPAQTAVARIAQQLDSSNSRLKDSSVFALEKIGGTEASAALEKDARRYAEADQAEAQRRALSADHTALQSFVTELPRTRRIQLARQLLGNQDDSVVWTGVAVLIRDGLEEEVVPSMARLILDPSNTAAGVTGFDWRAKGVLMVSRVKERLCAYLESNFPPNPTQDQEQIRRQICQPNR
jgi:HEAT repeat protein